MLCGLLLSSTLKFALRYFQWNPEIITLIQLLIRVQLRVTAWLLISRLVPKVSALNGLFVLIFSQIQRPFRHGNPAAVCLLCSS